VLRIEFKFIALDKKHKEAIVQIEKSGKILYSSDLSKDQMRYFFLKLEKYFSK